MRSIVILVILGVSSYLFLSNCGLVLAQSNSTASAEKAIQTAVSPGAIAIGDATISPASPLYFFKTLRERLEVMFASKTDDKMTRELEFAGRRLREVNSLVKSRQQDLIPSTLERYNLHIKQAEGMSNATDELRLKVVGDLSRHLDILQRIYDNVGNPLAKKSIMASIKKITEYNGQVIDQVNLPTQQDLVKEVLTRQAFACKFLAREATSSGMNDTEKADIGEKLLACTQSIQKQKMLTPSVK